MKTKITQQSLSKSFNQWGRKFLLASAILFGATSFSAQAQTSAPAKLWDKTYGGNEEDNAKTIIETPDGGYIIGGYSASGISGEKSSPLRAQCEDFMGCPLDYWIVKVDANGKKQWDKSYGWGGKENSHLLNSIVATTDGGYLLGGIKLFDWVSISSDYYVIKIDANGNKLWEKTFGGEQTEEFTQIVAVPDGGFLLTGTSESGAGKDKTEENKGTPCNGVNYPCSGNYWVVRIDANGNKLWDKTIGGDVYDKLTSALATPDGGFLIGGTSNSNKSGDKSEDSKASACSIGTRGLCQTDYWIVKLDGSGNKIWDRTIGGTKSEELLDILLTKEGSYLLAGSTESGIGADKTMAETGVWAVELNSSGEKLKDMFLFKEEVGVEIRKIRQDVDGGYVLGGKVSVKITPESYENIEFLAAKVDKNGTQLWKKVLGGPSVDELTSILVNRDGDYVLSGYTYSGVGGDKSEPSRGSYDFWAVKLKGETVGAKPEIAAFTPGSGLPGAIVTLTGKHLLSTTAITINGVRAGFKIMNDCEIKIAVPVAATTGKIEITTTNGTVLSNEVFTVLQPTIANLTPPVGAVGARFAIRGSHLSSTKQILINDVAVTEFTVVDNTLIWAVVPTGATSGKVTLVLKGGAKAHSSESFRVLTTGADKVEETKKLVAYPNPFVAGVILPVNLDNPGYVNILIYNTKGQQVKALNFTKLKAGEHQLEWDGKDGQNRSVTEGLYFYKLNVNGKLAAGQLLKTSK